jgi:hypothetical protein
MASLYICIQLSLDDNNLIACPTKARLVFTLYIPDLFFPGYKMSTVVYF